MPFTQARLKVKMKAKNLFTTGTMMGAYIMVIAFLTQGSPIITAMLDRNMKDKNADENIKSTLSLIVLFGGLTTVAVGRHKATKDVYTEDFLPGRNKSDIEVPVIPPKSSDNQT